MQVLIELIGQFLAEWLLFEKHKSRWLQALQVLGCLLFLFLFVMMILAVTGLLEKLSA